MTDNRSPGQQLHTKALGRARWRKAQEPLAHGPNGPRLSTRQPGAENIWVGWGYRSESRGLTSLCLPVLCTGGLWVLWVTRPGAHTLHSKQVTRRPQLLNSTHKFFTLLFKLRKSWEKKENLRGFYFVSEQRQFQWQIINNLFFKFSESHWTEHPYNKKSKWLP